MQERRRRIREVIERALDLGHFVVELGAFIQLMVEDTFVNGRGYHLHHKQQYTNRHKETQHRPSLKKDLRHMERHRFRRILKMYGRLEKIHGCKDNKRTPKKSKKKCDQNQANSQNAQNRLKRAI